MYLVKNILNDDYFTIRKQDAIEFLSLLKYCKTDSKFKIIYDKDLTKKIINDKFLSKGRGGDYDENLTSVTVITSKLFPKSLAKEKHLIKWMNDSSPEARIYELKKQIDNDIIDNIEEILTEEERLRIIDNLELQIKLKEEQEMKNLDSLEYGTDIHRVLELYVTDKKHHSLRNIEDYLKETQNYDICKEVLMYPKCLGYNRTEGNLIKNELKNIDCIYSELFMKDDKLGVQGTIDLICLNHGKYYLSDFKTTSYSKKEKDDNGVLISEKYIFKSLSQLENYQRQLCLYTIMAENLNILDKNIVDNLNYMLLVMHLKLKKYKRYEIENNVIMQHKDDIIKVVDWFQNSR